MPRISGTNQDAFPLGLELPPALPVVAAAGQCTILTTGVTPDPGRGLNFMPTPFFPRYSLSLDIIEQSRMQDNDSFVNAWLDDALGVAELRHVAAPDVRHYLHARRGGG